MKIHSTNYFDTFIEIAEDCPIDFGQTPPSKPDKVTVAEAQFDLINKNPYRFTSDDVLFMIFASKNDIHENEINVARNTFFSKGQPCFRTSPLTKRYGFGLHANHEGKVAVYGAETEEYQDFLKDSAIIKVKAMRNTKN